MTSVPEAVAALRAALESVAALGKRIHEDPGASVQGEASAVITPPVLEWGGFGGPEPSEATFVVHLVVPFDQYATARLYQLVEPVVAAIETSPLFSVASASPALLQMGGAQLPTYAITVDVGL